MLRKSVTLVLLATMAIAVAWAVPAALGQDANTILSNVSKAMGADNLKTLQYSGAGTEFAFGQAVRLSARNSALHFQPRFPVFPDRFGFPPDFAALFAKTPILAGCGQ